MIAATFAEIDRMKDQGPDQADLNKVKQNWLHSHQKSVRENGYWVSRLQSSLLQGTDPASILTYDKQAARRYFDLKNYVQVVLYPEK